ncbi:F-box associated domain containing protein, partial [Tanacetum coccineum]
PDLVSESDSEDEDETSNNERQYHGQVGNTYVCNPITREYVILPRPQYTRSIHVINNYSFGVDLLTNEHKVIWMFLGTRPRSLPSSLSYLLEAEVFTFGTGQWRRLGHVPHCINRSNGLFINGCVHWIVSDKHSPEKICSFNIDNVTFELFPSPPSIELEDDDFQYQNLGILNGCLSLCDSFSSEHELTVWVMKE